VSNVTIHIKLIINVCMRRHVKVVVFFKIKITDTGYYRLVTQTTDEDVTDTVDLLRELRM